MKPNKQSGVALVITLLMLSVITFMTVTFLALSRRDRASVTVSVTQRESRAMADAALARAQSEIIARMMGTLDASNMPEILNYDAMVSRNYITAGGYSKTLGANVNNVSYTYNANDNYANLIYGSPDFVQNVANLLFDPRLPVFVTTNGVAQGDFRYYVDLNRNGRFETNGFIPPILDDGTTANWLAYYVGEPEWIGVLRNPELPHSASNPGVGRFAYFVQPIGKSLEINYIHNNSKGDIPNNSDYSMTISYNGADGFMRDQGVGSWENNFAGYFYYIDPYHYARSYGNFYAYNAGALANAGPSFDDARELLRSRYNHAFTNWSATLTLGPSCPFTSDGIDGYGTGQTTNWPFDFTTKADPDNSNSVPTSPWAGSDNPVKFYNLQNELFDTTRFPVIAGKIMNVGSRNSSVARYTFQNLLNTACA